MKKRKVVLASIILIIAAGMIIATTVGAAVKPAAGPSLGGATNWLNSKPLTLGGLNGKVVLIDFWTYTCINWRRTLPYISAWADKYRGQGLVVIGVSTPEFSFEHKSDNVDNAAKEMKIDYPIAIDDNYSIWHAFGNEYWPAVYIIDASGRIRYHHFGEGAYGESEKVIQQLLKEAGATGVSGAPVSVDASGAEVAADWQNLQSPENYVGYGKTEGFVSTGGIVADRDKIYRAPTNLALNEWALSGSWTMGAEATVSDAANGKIRYRFHARALQLVMGPSEKGTPVRFRVLIDGQIPGTSHGVDVDSLGNGRVTEPRMYQLIRQQGAIVDRIFEIEFLDSGAAAYSFTFG